MVEGAKVIGAFNIIRKNRRRWTLQSDAREA